MISMRSQGRASARPGCCDPLPAPLVRATAVLACPHCRGRLRPEDRSLACRLGHRFDVARHGGVRLDVGRGRRRHEGDDRDMIEARGIFFDAGGFRAVTATLAAVAEQACGSRGSCWLLDAGAGTGHHSEGILNRVAGSHGVAVDVSRHALAAAARRHSRLAAVGADVWTVLPVRSNTVDVVLVAFAPRNFSEIRRVLRPDGRLLLLAPAADHLRELMVHTAVGIDAHKRERLSRKLGDRFALEHRVRVTERVHVGADVGAALYRMGPWARHDITRRRLETVTVAVELSVYRPGVR
jgi:23S rRNA (guanine745-N1)-methyltransferase